MPSRFLSPYFRNLLIRQRLALNVCAAGNNQVALFAHDVLERLVSLGVSAVVNLDGLHLVASAAINFHLSLLNAVCGLGKANASKKRMVAVTHCG